MSDSDGGGEEAREAFLPGTPGDWPFPEFLTSFYKHLVAATVASNALPLGDDYAFYNSYGDVARTLGQQQTALLASIQVCSADSRILFTTRMLMHKSA